MANHMYLFTVENCDYDEFDEVMVVAKDQPAARGILAQMLRTKMSKQSAVEFKVRVIDLYVEPAGVLCASMIRG